MAALVKQAFPVAWQHVNLYGRYEFRKQPEPVDVDEIVRELAEIPVDEERQRKLVKAQRAWLAYRDAEADFEADEVRGGTAYSMEYNGARTNLTNERVKALRELLQH